MTGEASLARLRAFEHTVEEASQRLRTQPSELTSALDRLLVSQRVLEEELRNLRSDQLRNEADELAAGALQRRRVRWPAGWSVVATGSTRASSGTLRSLFGIIPASRLSAWLRCHRARTGRRSSSPRPRARGSTLERLLS